MNYRAIIKQRSRDTFRALAQSNGGRFTGEQLPPNAIIVKKEDMPIKSDVKEEAGQKESVYVFRRVNEHGQLFHVPLDSPGGIHDAVRAMISEKGLQKERFFFQMGHTDSFIEATSRLTGEPIHADW